MAAPRPKENEKGLSPVGLVFFLLIAGGLTFVWFQYLSPFLFDQMLGQANQKFEYNKFSEAAPLYEKLLKKSPPALKQMIQDRLDQLALAEKHLMDPEPENPGFILQPLEAVTAKIGLVYIHYAIQNNTKEPLPIRRSLFYLKSTLGKCEVALDRPQNQEVNSWAGDLASGERVEGGICVKYVLVDPNEKLYLVYNNGKTYINAILSTSRIWPQTNRDQFTESWQGRKIAALPVGKSSPPPKKQPAPRPKNTPVPPPSIKTPVESQLQQPSPPPKTAPRPNPPAPLTQPKTLPPGVYVDSQIGFSIKIPPGWQKVNPARLPATSFAHVMPSVTVFRGPAWQESFPILSIQKVSASFGAGLAVNSETVNQMEKEIRQRLKSRGIKVKQLTGRTSLIGNMQAAQIDLTFEFRDESLRMHCFILEGSTGYMLSYVAQSRDFASHENHAIQAVRTFKPNPP